MLQYSQDKDASGYDIVTTALCPPGVAEFAACKLTLLEKLKAVTPETNRNSATTKSLGQWNQKKWVIYLWLMYDSQVCVHFFISSRTMPQTSGGITEHHINPAATN